ncbi:hypothetical protein GCM10010222_75710 [Streptomyces tanashiensis]|nr:hypothetical protein GCM10010222_75710 [Streptomyces tanashiensis]
MEYIDVAVIGGGQSGLAAARSLLADGLRPVVLEASERAAGSWPQYYDSLTLFSPARYSSLPGLPFGGDPDVYPHRDEVVAYLLRYAEHLDADIRTGHRVAAVRAAGEGFELDVAGGRTLGARASRPLAASAGRTARPCPGSTLSMAPCCTSRSTATRRRSRGSGSWWSGRGTRRCRSRPSSRRWRG